MRLRGRARHRLQATFRARKRPPPLLKRGHLEQRKTVWLIGSLLFALCYCTLLICSIAFYDPLTPLDDRILSPLAAVLAISVIALFAPGQRPQRPRGPLALASTPSGPRHTRGVAAFGTLACALMAASASGNLLISRMTGLGYRNKWWRNSETVRAVEGIPETKRIFTNDPDAVYALTGRGCSGLAGESSVAASSSGAAEQIDRQRHLIAARGCVVYFAKRNSLHAAEVTATLQELQQELQLRVATRCADGAILKPVRRSLKTPTTADTGESDD
jgi:hypothetical protein